MREAELNSFNFDATLVQAMLLMIEIGIHSVGLPHDSCRREVPEGETVKTHVDLTSFGFHIFLRY